jgi:hypothetical protein
MATLPFHVEIRAAKVMVIPAAGITAIADHKET